MGLHRHIPLQCRYDGHIVPSAEPGAMLEPAQLVTAHVRGVVMNQNKAWFYL